MNQGRCFLGRDIPFIKNIFAQTDGHPHKGGFLELGRPVLLDVIDEQPYGIGSNVYGTESESVVGFLHK